MNPTPRPYLRAVPSREQPERRFEALRRIGTAEPGQMPDSLRDEMREADALWQTLRDEGRQLHYEVDEATGRVTAELRDLAGATHRPVALTQALGAPDDDSPAA